MPEEAENYVKDSLLHFAMRETQASLRRRGVWVALSAVGLILGLVGPFDTEDYLRLLPRLAYWMAVVALTFATGVFVSALVERTLAPRALGTHVVPILAGIAIGIVIAAEILALNWVLFDVFPFQADVVLPLAVNGIIVSIIISLALNHFHGAASSDTSEAPRILSRLPFEKRGALMALSVSDHYVEVTTTKGKELVLMRLSDAMDETGTVAGLQVHRSHWVALNAVEKSRREGAKAVLTLKTGDEVPVSRTYLPAVKRAGLLPG